jgi:hypothetical protein
VRRTKKRVIVFNLCGNGLLDLAAYDTYLSGRMHADGGRLGTYGQRLSWCIARGTDPCRSESQHLRKLRDTFVRLFQSLQPIGLVCPLGRDRRPSFGAGH